MVAREGCQCVLTRTCNVSILPVEMLVMGREIVKEKKAYVGRRNAGRKAWLEQEYTLDGTVT